MGAAFAGIVGTPMTSVIMIFELTRDYTIIVPLMITFDVIQNRKCGAVLML